MKKTALLTFLAIICMVLLSYCGGSGQKSGGKTSLQESSSADAAPVIRKYGVKSGIITFENSGFGLTTKAILYFDDWGTKEAEEKYDIDGSLKETNLCDGKNTYILIHKDKAAYLRGQCYRGVAYKFDWNEASRSGDEYQPAKLANQMIAGKDCESFSLNIAGSKTMYAGWNNICLLIETKSGEESIIYKAVSVEEDANVPAEKLRLPADYKVE